MITFALLGTGRIGQMHAEILAAHPKADLRLVYDALPAVAQEVADAHNARVAEPQAILSDASIDAVLIASPTDTHIDLMTQAVQAGKAVLCEKPLDLDIERVHQCADMMEQATVPFQIGFNRRYDPSHKALADAVANGKIGNLEALIISSRDPLPPPADYICVSGGLFRDMMIHDFDIARYILGEEPVQIQATGSVQVDKEIGKLGDIDSAMVTLKTASGTLCHINCSRRSVYGYDQRIEAFGSSGMLLSDNPRVHNVLHYGDTSNAAQAAMHYFFIERYQQAYIDQLDAFIGSIESGEKPTPGFDDGRKALILAGAAQQSFLSGETVPLVLK